MRKALLPATLVVAAIGAALLAFGVPFSSAGPPPPPCTSPCNFTPGVLSPDFTNGAAPVSTGSTITTTDGTWDGFTSIDGYKFQSGSTVLQSGLSNTYTVTSADANETITAYVEGCDVSCVWQESTGSAKVVGSSQFADDFSGALNSKPSSTLWSFPTGTNGALTLNGSSELGETGTGSLESQVVNSGGTWYGSQLISNSTYTGERYVEARIKVNCYASTGVDWAAFDYSAGTPNDNLEIDLNEQWSGSTANQDSHQYNVHHWNNASEWHTSKWNNINTGSAVCGNYHTYGEAVYSDHIDFYYDGSKVWTVNKTDCSFADADGTPSPYVNGGGADGDCSSDTDSDGNDAIQNFTNYVQTFALLPTTHIDNSCPTDESEGTSDSDDSCTSDTDTASNDTDSDGKDGVYGSGPVQMFIDYVHINNLTG